ncbi:MAG: adenylate/guanylate cyclase protein, partial [Patescibacteria group bacterium]|nr:adenylate/guanylate cyclase protein [Patescibacteria group bacterium]
MPAPNLSKLAPYAAAGVISVTLAVTGVFAIFDNALYDIFSKLSTTPDPYGKIVLVTVDAKTVERYGNESFWTRTRYRELLDELESAGAKAVYFDYFFSEKTKPENVDWDVLRESAGMSEESLDEAYLRYDKTTKSKDFTSEIDYDFARAIKTYG